MKPIRPKQDLVPLSEFRANVSELLKQVQRTERPIVVTQHGRASAVLMSVDEYEALLEQIEYLRALGQSLAQSATGRTVSHDDVMASAKATVDKLKKRKATA
jgi:antitoxin YefM